MSDEPQIAVEPVDEGYVAVVLAGEFDLENAAELEHELTTVLEGDKCYVLIDLSACEFLDSSILRVLVHAQRESDGRILLIGPQPPVRRVLEVTRLTETLPIYPTRASVINAYAGSDTYPPQ